MVFRMVHSKRVTLAVLTALGVAWLPSTIFTCFPAVAGSGQHFGHIHPAWSHPGHQTDAHHVSGSDRSSNEPGGHAHSRHAHAEHDRHAHSDGNSPETCCEVRSERDMAVGPHHCDLRSAELPIVVVSPLEPEKVISRGSTRLPQCRSHGPPLLNSVRLLV